MLPQKLKSLPLAFVVNEGISGDIRIHMTKLLGPVAHHKHPKKWHSATPTSLHTSYSLVGNSPNVYLSKADPKSQVSNHTKHSCCEGAKVMADFASHGEPMGGNTRVAHDFEIKVASDNKSKTEVI